MIQYQSSETTVFQSVLYKTTSTVIETVDLTLVVDPNWLPNEVDEVCQRVNQRGVSKPLYLLFTHSHYDHIIGYRAFPGAITIGSVGMKNLPNKENVIGQIKEFDSKYYVERPYPLEYPLLDIVVDHDQQQLIVGDTTLTFYLAPGHSQDGVFTVIEPSGVLLTGDYLSNVEFPFIYDSSTAYIKTMNKVKRILQHPIKLLVPGHGSATTDIMEINCRVQESIDYIESLKLLILAERIDEAECMLDKYIFAQGLRSEHAGNIKKIREELGAPRDTE